MLAATTLAFCLLNCGPPDPGITVASVTTTTSSAASDLAQPVASSYPDNAYWSSLRTWWGLLALVLLSKTITVPALLLCNQVRGRLGHTAFLSPGVVLCSLLAVAAAFAWTGDLYLSLVFCVSGGFTSHIQYLYLNRRQPGTNGEEPGES